MGDAGSSDSRFWNVDQFVEEWLSLVVALCANGRTLVSDTEALETFTGSCNISCTGMLFVGPR
jgi:hypothetical protein